MKKIILSATIASLIILGSYLPTSAQNGINEISITVSTQVISTIEMITIQSIDLSEAEAVNDRIRIDALNSSNAGKMIVIGSPNSDFRISFLERRELTQSNGSTTLLFNYQVVGNNQDDQSTAEILDQENRDFEFNDEGRFYLWIGGDVDISTAEPGSYQGEFTLDIESI